MAIAKGAGMIEPNMATMLAYILTDLDVPKATLDAILKVRPTPLPLGRSLTYSFSPSPRGPLTLPPPSPWATPSPTTPPPWPLRHPPAPPSCTTPHHFTTLLSNNFD